MNNEEKYYEHSRVFRAYVVETPKRDNYGMYRSRNESYKFVLELVSMKDYVNDEELPLSMKINSFCKYLYKSEDGTSNRVDDALKERVMPSIHVGSHIEFKGIAYKRVHKKEPTTTCNPTTDKKCHSNRNRSACDINNAPR